VKKSRERSFDRVYPELAEALSGVEGVAERTQDRLDNGWLIDVPGLI
jgi:hypothetical protein